MKNLYLFLIGLAVLTSCGTDPEPSTDPLSCSPTSVTLFDEAFTRFMYEGDGKGGQQLFKVSVYDGTDSSYFYTYTYGTNLETISQTEGGETVVFTATYNNDKLTKLTSGGSPGSIAVEFKFVYGGSNVTTNETWAKAEDGNFYQIAHFAMTYNGDGNLVISEIYIDFAAFFAIAFGGVPDSPYAAVKVGSVEYEYGSNKAPNPVYGSYFMENPDMTFMKNLPVTIIYKDENGAVTDSEAYTITLDKNGYPTKSVSGALYLEATYVCK